MGQFYESHSIIQHLNPEEVEAIKMLDQMYSAEAEGIHPATGNILHFWGQFTADLPDTFQPNGPGGHQYIYCKNQEEAEMKCQELRKIIFDTWPDSLEWAGKGWYKWIIHDMRQMTLEFNRD